MIARTIPERLLMAVRPVRAHAARRGSAAAAHGRSPRSRPRSASRERAPASGAGGGSVTREGADDACLSGCAIAVDIWIILSRGRYSRLLPALASIRILATLDKICWMVSR